MSAGRSLPPLRDAFITPGDKRAYVRGLFATIADRYDLITRLLSYGQDRRWKERLVTLAAIRSGSRALDLACGTGDIAFALSRAGADTVALDLTHRMLELARLKRRPGDRVRFVAGDMMGLPFQDATFSVVTTGYGIRNVPEIAPALREILRVLKPGGIFLSLDFNRPDSRIVRAVYHSYLTIVGSALGLVLHRNADTYRYIPESIRRYPGAHAVSRVALAQGFARCDWLPVLGGLMAIHRAFK